MMRIHKEGISSLMISMALLVVFGAVSLVLWPLGAWAVILVLLVPVLFFLQFFRNPVRFIPTEDSKLVYAPADGKVVVIEQTEETEFLKD